VKNAGGRVLVQDPRTALSPVAPEAAMECTVVDSVLALPRIAERLASMFAAPGSTAQ
jgi:chemotaxis response regulator CheB